MIGIGVTEIALILTATLSLFFWVWMLIDCVKRSDNMFAAGGNYAKLIWVLIIIFTHVIGALLYYFMVKRKEST